MPPAIRECLMSKERVQGFQLKLKLGGVATRSSDARSRSWLPVTAPATPYQPQTLRIERTDQAPFHFRAVTRGLQAQARTFAEFAENPSENSQR